MMLKKLLSILLVFILACSSLISFGGCGESEKNVPGENVVDAKKDSLAESATPLEYSTGINSDGKYDDSLFYSNDFNLFSTGADPSMFYYDGYYYMYSTSGGKPLICYRTKNFASWEYMGVAYDFSAAYKDGKTWANSYYWAPEAFEWEGKFYMYVTVSNVNCPDAYPEGLEELAAYVQSVLDEGKTVSYSQISTKSKELYGVTLTAAEFSVSNVLLVSDTPQGPYELWTGKRTVQKYYHGEKVGEPVIETVTEQTTPFFDWANAPAAWKENKYLFELTEEERATYETDNNVKRIWEANIFANLDGMLLEEENGDLYYYFTKSADSNGSKGGIWGCKMLNPWTPDYSTLTRLTEPRKITVGGKYTYGDATTEGTMDGGINEGPYVMKHTTVKPDGNLSIKYYLTYSTGKKSVANNYGYNIAVAVSDSPLGPFKKLEEKYGNPIYMTSGEYGALPSSSWTHGSGHGTFCTVGDETFLIAHSTQSNSSTGVDCERMPIIDKLTWSYSEELGYDLPHMNGPSKNTLQPQPVTATGYKNIAPQASVTATNVVDESSISYLNDDYRVIHESDKNKQFHSHIGGTTITLTFNKPMSVRAIMVYNSRDIKYAFSKIDYILFENGSETKVIKDLDYPESGLTAETLETSSICPGGAAIAEFNEMSVTKITLKITAKFSIYEDELIEGVEYDPDMYGISISDIVVLGNDGSVSGDTSIMVDEENFKGSNMTDKSNVDLTMEERIELDRNLFDVSGNHGSGYDIKYSTNGNIQVGAGINVPFKENSRTSNGFVASISSYCSSSNRSWNNAAIAVYTGSEGKTNLQYKIFAVGGNNEVRIFFVHYGAPWAERSYSLPYEGYKEADNGKAHTLTVIYQDSVFYIGFAKEGSDMRWIKIDKDTEYYTTYKSGIPRNADVSGIFAQNDKVIGVATTDKYVVFTDISYSCNSFEVIEAINDVVINVNNCISSNGKVVLEKNEYLLGDMVNVLLKASTGYELSQLQINGNIVDISDLVSVEKDGGITEYVYNLYLSKSGNYTIFAKYTKKETV